MATLYPLSSHSRLAGIDPNTVEHRSGVRHASFFFPSGPDHLYAALYAPVGGCRFSVVVCPSWGVETMRLLQWYYRLACDLASSGIATLVPHWPGTEDSEGDPRTVTLDRLVAVVVDAQSVLADRSGTDRVGLIGVRVGAAVASLAAPMLSASRLALAQPVFDINAHFEREEKSARRAQLGRELPPEWAWGYPHPSGLRQLGDASRVRTSLEAYSGKGAIVQYRKPEPEPVHHRLRTLTVWGDWRRPTRVDHGPLRVATTRWLKRSLRGGR
jgi:hypothetical protein